MTGSHRGAYDHDYNRSLSPRYWELVRDLCLHVPDVGIWIEKHAEINPDYRWVYSQLHPQSDSVAPSGAFHFELPLCTTYDVPIALFSFCTPFFEQI